MHTEDEPSIWEQLQQSVLVRWGSRVAIGFKADRVLYRVDFATDGQFWIHFTKESNEKIEKQIDEIANQLTRNNGADISMRQRLLCNLFLVGMDMTFIIADRWNNMEEGANAEDFWDFFVFFSKYEELARRLQHSWLCFEQLRKEKNDDMCDLVKNMKIE